MYFIPLPGASSRALCALSVSEFSHFYVCIVMVFNYIPYNLSTTNCNENIWYLYVWGNYYIVVTCYISRVGVKSSYLGNGINLIMMDKSHSLAFYFLCWSDYFKGRCLCVQFVKEEQLSHWTLILCVALSSNSVVLLVLTWVRFPMLVNSRKTVLLTMPWIIVEYFFFSGFRDSISSRFSITSDESGRITATWHGRNVTGKL